MAIYNPSTGTISGTIGNFVYRVRNGRTVVSKRSSRVRHASPGTLVIQNKFGFITKVSAAINRNRFLKFFWPKKRGYENIVKENFQHSFPDLPGYHPIIVPGFGFSLKNAQIIFSDTGLILEADPLGEFSGINPETEKNMNATGIMILRDPTGADIPMYAKPIFSRIKPIDLNKPIQFEIQFLGEDLREFQEYKRVLANITLVTLDKDCDPVNHSIVIAEERKR